MGSKRVCEATFRRHAAARKRHRSPPELESGLVESLEVKGSLLVWDSPPSMKDRESMTPWLTSAGVSFEVRLEENELPSRLGRPAVVNPEARESLDPDCKWSIPDRENELEAAQDLQLKGFF